ncbi:MAG: TonB-dependent receptor [Bacteroidales bacterium]|nr:TonB-dependent receptor [Bacteroidales bacterium]
MSFHKNHRSTFILLCILFTIHWSLVTGHTFSQPILRQSIKGIVLDQQTLSPLPGATVILIDIDSLVGTVSDNEGHFRLERIPIGTHRIQVSYVGYATYESPDIIVSSGKESVITVYLKEKVLTAKEVEIRGRYQKYQPINRMATVSVRNFSVDETFRFAGSYNDPARMAQNFAGVTSGVDNRNDIIVRGNSPMGLQWRLDDMEIPNPNHFAAVGTTGGPVTVLNNNLLTNSDFFSGAFPAQYGNTVAGVFDLRMRNGNNDRREYWFEIGWNGLEFGTEGPFTKKSPASYLFAYRYSMLELISYLGINLNLVPQYQDLNVKFTIPSRKAGTFTITGMGGLSYIELFDSEKSQERWMFPDYGENLANGSNLGVFGVTHQIMVAPKTRWKNMLYIVGSKVYTKIDTFSNVITTPSPWAGERTEEIKLSFSSQIFRKFSPKNSLDAGIFVDYFWMSFADSMMWKGSFLVNTGSNEQMSFLRAFTQWRHAFSNRFSITTGLFGSLLTLNNSQALEPRLGFDWIINDRHSLNFGTGLYSQMQPRVIYFLLAHHPDGNITQPNLEMDFTRSWQVAVGYNYLLTDNLRFKVETYYQYLYDIPVKRSIPEFALINQGHEFFLDRQYADSLINLGSGENYGVEFTFERFFKKNYYFLLTASLFNSTYKGYDKIERNSAFNVNYAMNAVGGYEFVVGKRKWGILSFGLRATWAGGNPYIPYDVTASMATGEPIPDWNRAYEPRFPSYKRIAFRFGIKRNMPKYNLEFLLDLQYRTNYTNIALQRINPKTGEIRYYFQMGFFPMGTWRIQF